VIYLDPPTHHVNRSAETGSDRSTDNHYAHMSLAEIADLEKKLPAATDCIMYLWVPYPLLLEMGDIMRHRWGFRYSTSHIWVKDRIGTGKRARENAEHILIGLRGEMAAPSPEDRLPYVFFAPRRGPSEKPPLVAEHIERVYPAPLTRIEMFAHPPFRPGWWVWGDAVPGGLVYEPPLPDDRNNEREATMTQYTFEYMVPEAERWTRSRNGYANPELALAEGERFLRMMMPRSTNTLIRVVPVAD
jgi:N6-adenosine-specific RNA methylase IME4